MIYLVLILGYLGIVNLMAYRAFADDKRRAINKDQRTPEATLLWWASIGGWFGAKYAQQKLRHKSYKQPFGSRLNIIGIVHAMAVVAMLATLGLTALSLNGNPFNHVYQMATDARQAHPPDDGSPRVSLRPPAGRP